MNDSQIVLQFMHSATWFQMAKTSALCDAEYGSHQRDCFKMGYEMYNRLKEFRNLPAYATAFNSLQYSIKSCIAEFRLQKERNAISK